jgi:prepilin-type N-terminal cleavage/methylation domain-containing protein
MHNQKGFSLVELLIVVAIIAIIVAIAIPNLLTSRQSAQASAAAGDLRTINSAEIGYSSGPGNGSFGTFTELEAGKMLPTGFSTSASAYTRSGYTGTLTMGTNNTSYTCVSSPAVISEQAPSYFTDESGAIRFSTSGAASSASTPMGQAQASGS